MDFVVSCFSGPLSLFLSLSVCLSLSLSVSVCLSVCLSVSLSLCVCTCMYEYCYCLNEATHASYIFEIVGAILHVWLGMLTLPAISCGEI